jgi:hypothetical protein
MVIPTSFAFHRHGKRRTLQHMVLATPQLLHGVAAFPVDVSDGWRRTHWRDRHIFECLSKDTIAHVSSLLMATSLPDDDCYVAVLALVFEGVLRRRVCCVRSLTRRPDALQLDVRLEAVQASGFSNEQVLLVVDSNARFVRPPPLVSSSLSRAPRFVALTPVSRWSGAVFARSR